MAEEWPVPAEPSINEVDFCGQIATVATHLLSQKPNPFSPFKEVRIEGYGKANRKRKDLRFYDGDNKLILCGEVKLPGTPEGRSAFDDSLMQDAAAKADDAGVQYFFTWNVNQFVLFDRSQWHKPLLERRMFVRSLGKQLADAREVAREENLDYIKTEFLPLLLAALSSVFGGEEPAWLPKDEVFLHVLASRLDWPMRLTAEYIQHEAAKSKAFEGKVQTWMRGQDWPVVGKDNDLWPQQVDNMAKTLAYVWSNRLIFYKALCRRFDDLKELKLPPRVRLASEAVAALNSFLKRAVERSGDYEPLLLPDADDWATALAFQAANAIDAWRGFIHALESFDFHEVPSDVLGRIFQKLIGPEERHRYGQHFTGDDAVDLINSFCIHSAADTVLDPACGSGSFLVRAYYRKRTLGPDRPHADRIAELFGCDISMYPAHLATLNLAAREIVEEANYPRIARQNFFDFDSAKPFCKVPEAAGGQIMLPLLDAVVGNPPYVRHENVDKADKKRFGQLAEAGWSGLELPGRSDLYCYFWPQAARLLKPNGYFGFLTSSSWLDVEYGFAIQGWMLRHFRILAVMESAAEPWFTDARVKTCATILQRCDDEEVRMANRVRFVRFDRKLADILRVAPGENDAARQGSIDSLRAKILGAETDSHDADMRIVVKSQRDLWEDGVRAGIVLGDAAPVADTEVGEEMEGEAASEWWHPKGDYSAGKWGRYLRAPDVYFDIVRKYGSRFVPLGEVATIRFGVKTGCDAFFMPRDISEEMLREHPSDREFREHAGGAPRAQVEAGEIKIVRAGDNSVHPIEAEHLLPEVHSLMKVDRPVIRAADLDRVVLLVKDPMKDLKTNSPWVWRYLKYGQEATFESSKSTSSAIPFRSTCAARDPWYNLIGVAKPGIAFWPMAQQYRHIIAANPERLICNHNLFDVSADEITKRESESLVAVLNSTLVGLFKTFYGRYAGTEGNLKTEVIDVNFWKFRIPAAFRRTWPSV